MTTIHRTLIIGCSAIALGGCGADEIVSPGTSGDVNVTITNPPAPAPTPTPAPTSSLVTPAAGCPTIAATGGLTDGGTIQGPTGTYRVCQLPALVDADSTLPFISGIVYAIPGRVDIGTDQGAASTGSQVELTVEPGVILYGSTGRSFLVANRGNQLLASGTADRPIIFTSRDNIQGLSNDTSIGQWGGIVLLGRAPVSDCRTGVINPAGPEPVRTGIGGHERHHIVRRFQRWRQLRPPGIRADPLFGLQSCARSRAAIANDWRNRFGHCLQLHPDAQQFGRRHGVFRRVGEHAICRRNRRRRRFARRRQRCAG